jgi:hypothetical protein
MMLSLSPVTLATNGIQLGEVAGFLQKMLMRSTKLSATTKLFAEHETPPVANVLLALGILSGRIGVILS